MPTVVAHLGDFHAAPGPGRAQQFQVLDRVIAELTAVAARPDPPRLGLWLWPGDLSDKRQAIDDKNALAERIVQLGNLAPGIICEGNHDLPGDLDVFAAPQFLNTNYPVYVVDYPRTLAIELATGELASVFVLPFPTKAGLVSLGVVPAAVHDVAGEALEAIFRQAAIELETARQVGHLTLMCGHVNVAGAQIATGQPQIGYQIEIGGRHLAMLGDIYKGLNHIHLGQEIQGAWYPGSMTRLSWGEIDPKRYLLVDLGHGAYTVRAQPIDVPPRYHVEGELRRDGFFAVTDPPPHGSWAGCEVRVRYTFRQSEKAVLDHASVRAPFAEALMIKVEPVAIPDRALRAPGVAQALTLADKVRAWADAESVQTTESVLDKLARLEHNDGPSVIITVQDQITALRTAPATPEVAV